MVDKNIFLENKLFDSNEDDFFTSNKKDESSHQKYDKYFDIE